MKRRLWLALPATLALLFAGCVAGPPAWADAPYGLPGWVWPAELGAGYGFGLYGQIPADKQAGLRVLGVDTQRKVIGLQAGSEAQVAAYPRAVGTYPLDASAATKAWDAMPALSRQMVQLRLEARTQAQQIMGQERWDPLRGGRGIYFGAPPRR